MRVRASEPRRPEMAPKKVEAPVVEEGEDPRAAPRDTLLAVLHEKLRAEGTVRASDRSPPRPHAARTVSTVPPPLLRASSHLAEIGTHARNVPLVLPPSSRPEHAWTPRHPHARRVPGREQREGVHEGGVGASLGGDLVHRARRGRGRLRRLLRRASRWSTPRLPSSSSRRAPAASWRPHARSRNLSRARAFPPVRVCASTDDMAVAFPAFASAFVNVKTLEAYEPEEEERVLKTTSGVNVAMLKLGAMLRECAGDAGRMETTLRTLASGFTELPTMPQLMGLLRTEEGAPTLEEFLDVYDAALDVDLDSENVWPMPPPLRF